MPERPILAPLCSCSPSLPNGEGGCFWCGRPLAHEFVPISPVPIPDTLIQKAGDAVRELARERKRDYRARNLDRTREIDRRSKLKQRAELRRKGLTVKGTQPVRPGLRDAMLKKGRNRG